MKIPTFISDLTLSEHQCAQLSHFVDLIHAYHSKINLISAGDLEKIWSRHILDSLQPILHTRAWNVSHETFPTDWGDMGSGAGFPVIPLCIARPETRFIAIEPRSKRAAFLNTVISALNLKNITILNCRAEEVRDREFPVISCRALGSAEEDWRRAKKLLQPNGVFITFKSFRESRDIAPGWEVIPYELPGEDKSYCLMVRRS